MTMLPLAAAATLLVVLSSAPGPSPSPVGLAALQDEAAPVDAGKWLRSNKKALTKLAEAWWGARPATRFDDWDPAVRADLLERLEAFGPLPELGAEGLAQLVELLWEEAVDAWPDGLSKAGKDKVELPTPYGDAWAFLTAKKPKRGETLPLVLGLHGGGEGAGSAGEARGNWPVKDAVALYPQGIHLVHDTWNTVEGERFLLTLIEWAKVRQAVDPDRVHSVGFSMGGTGSWFLAGRHADLLAGAMPCAGVLMAAPKSQVADPDAITSLQHGLVPNVRNLAMHYFIGLADTNCMPGTYLYVERMLASLRDADPGGYANVRFQTYPGLAHAFPPGEPQRGLEWILEQRRDTFPAVVVWEVVEDPFPQHRPGEARTRLAKTDFYWLSCAEPVDAQRVRAEREGNRIRLTVRGRVSHAGLTLRLNPTMIDPAEEVVVEVDGEEVWRGRPTPTLADVLVSMDARMDRAMVFDRRIDL